MDISEKKYLAYIGIMGGGSWAYGETYEAAAESCMDIFVSDWGSMFDIWEQDLPINVYYVEHHDDFTMGHNGVFGMPNNGGEREQLERYCLVHVTVPKRYKQHSRLKRAVAEAMGQAEYEYGE